MFCWQCGEKLPDNALFCQKCGAKIGSTSAPSQKVKLILDRASQAYLVNPPIKAVVNNNTYVSIENGHTETVELDPGPCTLELSSGFRKTRLELNLKKDTVVQIGFNRLSGKLMAEIK